MKSCCTLRFPRWPSRLGFFFLASAMFATSCSFLFVSGPPPHDQRIGRFDCTTTMAAPVVDGVLAALQVLGLVWAASKSDAEVREAAGIPRDNAIGVSISWAILYTASAVHGASRVSDCRDALGTDEPPRPQHRTRREMQNRRQEEAAEEAAVRARVKASAAPAENKSAEPPTPPATPTQ